MRQIEFRDCTGLAFHIIPGKRDRLGTERDSCPEISGFGVPRDFSTGTALSLGPGIALRYRFAGPGSRHCPVTTAYLTFYLPVLQTHSKSPGVLKQAAFSSQLSRFRSHSSESWQTPFSVRF